MEQLQQNLWRRGKMTNLREMIYPCRKVLQRSLSQTQSRSRDCNVAQNGGSTAVCTSSETATRSCSTNACRKFFFCLYCVLLFMAGTWKFRCQVLAPNICNLALFLTLIHISLQQVGKEPMQTGTSVQAAFHAHTSRFAIMFQFVVF